MWLGRSWNCDMLSWCPSGPSCWPFLDPGHSIKCQPEVHQETYHILAKQWHPDKKEEGKRKMPRKNLKGTLIQEEKKENDVKKEEEIDKPWISYLRNLRIPMMWQLHRKVSVSISENSLKATPPQAKKRDKSPIWMKKRNINRNPNWNHNSNFLLIFR